MKIAVFSIKPYEQYYLNQANANQHQLDYFEEKLSLTSVSKSAGYEGICCFVTDDLSQAVVEKLAQYGVKLIALRSAGYDHVDMTAAKAQRICVVRVPSYFPQSIAEFAVALILSLNRKIITAYQRGLQYHFSLEGLMGFNLYEKTVGIVGTGHIGTAFAKMMTGFSCRLLAYDLFQNPACQEMGVHYVTLEKLLNESDIVSLHCPLNPETHYLINQQSLLQMKKGAMLINTARGGVVDTVALIGALKSGRLGFAGLDVYENERDLFFMNHDNLKKDPLLSELQSMPNVLITPHQAFLTKEAIVNITKTTIDNITVFEQDCVMNRLLA